MVYYHLSSQEIGTLQWQNFDLELGIFYLTSTSNKTLRIAYPLYPREVDELLMLKKKQRHAKHVFISDDGNALTAAEIESIIRQTTE